MGHAYSPLSMNTPRGGTLRLQPHRQSRNWVLHLNLDLLNGRCRTRMRRRAGSRECKERVTRQRAVEERSNDRRTVAETGEIMRNVTTRIRAGVALALFASVSLQAASVQALTYSGPPLETSCQPATAGPIPAGATVTCTLISDLSIAQGNPFTASPTLPTGAHVTNCVTTNPNIAVTQPGAKLPMFDTVQSPTGVAQSALGTSATPRRIRAPSPGYRSTSANQAPSSGRSRSPSRAGSTVAARSRVCWRCSGSLTAIRPPAM